MYQLKYTNYLTPNGKNKLEVLVQNMLKCISQVYENHSNNPIKLIVHLQISFGSDFLLVIRKISNWFSSIS